MDIKKSKFIVGFYPKMISQLYSTVQVVWDFLRHDPTQPTQPVNSEAHRHFIIHQFVLMHMKTTGSRHMVKVPAPGFF